MSNSALASKSEPLAEKLKRATKPRMICIAPHVYAPLQADAETPEYSLGRFSQAEPGKFTFKPIMEHMVRVNAELLRLIGMEKQYHTLVRLHRAGFIEMVLIAPGTRLLNLDSWYNHVRRCAEAGEGFWAKESANLKEYRKALA